MTQRYKVTFEYLGTPFYGLVKQPGLKTVQGQLETAIESIVGSGNASPIVVSSRTDAGVHATANVLHLDLTRRARQVGPLAKPFESPDLLQALNAKLRSEALIQIRQVEKVPSSFHARYSAVSREYMYQMILPDPKSSLEPYLLPSKTFNPKLAWQLDHALDLQSMQEAALRLKGTHDFTSFRSIACDVRRSPVRTLSRCDILCHPCSTLSRLDQALHVDLIQIHVEANSFLYHMVRNIVGLLVGVGKGDFDPRDVEVILEAGNRACAPPMAPAHGLYLTAVHY